MKVPVLLLLTAALSFAGRGNAADHGLKSVRVTTPQGYDRDLLQDNLQAVNAHANGGKGVLELPLPYALQPLLAVRRGHSAPLPKGTVIYKKGSKGDLPGNVYSDRRPTESKITVKWLKGSGRVVPIQGTGLSDLLIMREHRNRKDAHRAHVALLPPAATVTVAITPQDHSVYGFEILGPGQGC
jgi:hypothetical protein